MSKQVEIFKSDTYPFKPPSWGEISGGGAWPRVFRKIYYAMDGDRLLGFLIILDGYYRYDGIPSFINITQLEVNPDYRRRGIGTLLMNQMFRDHPDNNFHLQAFYDSKVLAFYTQMGFRLFYIDVGSDIPFLIKSAPGNTIDEVIAKYEIEDAYPEDDTTYAGCIWSSEEQRFINDSRTYKEEIEAVKKDPWQIASVKRQTLELQILAVIGEVCVIRYILNPEHEIRILAITTDYMEAECLLEPLTEEEKTLIDNLRNK